MLSLKSRVALIACVVLVVPAISAVLIAERTSDFNPVKVAAVAHRYANSTPEQHTAILQEIRAERHPRWKTLSTEAQLERAARVAMRLIRQASGADSVGALAPFVGNQTVIRNTSGNLIALQRQQSDCSLSLLDGSYSWMNPTGSLQLSATTTHFEQVLHNEAGLTTMPDAFSSGCADATLGIGTRRAGYLGAVSGGLFLVGTGYESPANQNAVYFALVNPDSTTTQSGSLSSNADTSAAAADTGSLTVGDLNGDGLADVVGAGSGTLHVWLANANGTLSAPATYTLSGDTTEAAVIVDVNGDGKPDVVAATRSGSSPPFQEQICVLLGAGSGTLGSPQCFNVATQTTATGQDAFIGSLIAADLRGNNSQDIVASNGLVLLNNGQGGFSSGTSQFAPTSGTSGGFGPNMAAADFNKDGKIDVAVDNGTTVRILLGNGDGTFSAGQTYSSNSEVGYLTATDLDGDGNVDLYIGIANSGLFGGDEFDASQSYALMGNGDGTFQGAPVLPFVYNGTNLADLNGDGHIDAVGYTQLTNILEQSTITFTNYLGDGKGNFTAHSSLSTNNLTFSNAIDNPYSFGADSFGIGDINGDGKPDLVIADGNLNIHPLTGTLETGFLIAFGDGTGAFGTPTFLPSSGFVPTNDGDAGAYLTDIRVVDVNGDGKPDLVFNYLDYDITTSPYTPYSGVAVQLGNGDGTFQAPRLLVLASGSTLDANYLANIVGVTDLNGDHKPDLLLMAVSPPPSTGGNIVYTLEVALGNGDGTFGAPTPVTLNDALEGFLYGTYTAPLSVADMNGDGIPDLISLGVSSSDTLQVAVALGKGDGTFQTPNKFNYSVGYSFQGLAVGDFNGDGKLDVAIESGLGSEDGGITFGNGDGTLSTQASGQAQLNDLFYLPLGGASTAYDFNGDGKTDLLIGQTLLLNATSTGSFALSASSTAGTVTPGQSVQTTLTVAPSGGFTGAVSLSCSGLPAGATCQFGSSSVSLSSTSATSTLSITTTAATANSMSAPRQRPAGPWEPGALLLAGLGMPWPLMRGLRAKSRRSGWLLMLLVGLTCLHGCGGGSAGSSTAVSSSGASSSGGSGSSSGSSSSGSSSSGGSQTATPAGQYQVTIQATGGSTIQTLQYTLTVS